MKKLSLIILSLVLITISLPYISAETQEKDVCAVYITGIGCPHCASTDPVLLIDLLEQYPNFVIIEYEIYQQTENGPLIISYNSRYNTGLGIPLIIFEHGYQVGGRSILGNINDMIERGSSECLLIQESVSFDELDVEDLPGKPKIWTKERILIKSSNGNINNNELLRNLLTSEVSSLSSLLGGFNYKIIESEKVALSGQYVEFENAIEINSWIFQWNGNAIGASNCPICPEPEEWSICENNIKTRINYKCSAETNYECVSQIEVTECNTSEKLTFVKLISLAAVDAVNPCALAVLTLLLIAILTYNPRNKKKVLLAGLAFTASVFIMYLIYGLIIIKVFQIVQVLTTIRIWLYKILGLGAMILGILNLKDFIKYRPGGTLTEMPLSMRPKLQRIISKVTGPKGAFIVGIFVTVFLLPCTIGPYVIVGGILSALELIKTIPFLLLYNLIFVLPMIIITILVYTGFARVEDVSGWKEKNIRYLHLIAGIIMFALGLAMLVGWV